MAAQAALIAETIAGMKRALRRHDPSSDSDGSPPRATNRGNKLKRKAEFAHEGHLSGRKSYKTKIDYAGYQRYIISRNPKRYDEYGDELDDYEVDEEADADAAERNPYREIKLEELLMPLTAAADLPTHPSLSIPYKSDVLPGMVQQACEMVHKERRTLWEIKHLLTKFRGCDTWIPCELFLSDNDTAIFGDQSTKEKAPLSALNLDNGIMEARSAMAPNNQNHENSKREKSSVDARASKPAETGNGSGKDLGLEVEAATVDANVPANDRAHGRPEAMEISAEVHGENDQIDRLEKPNQYRSPSPVDNTNDPKDREPAGRPRSETNTVGDDQRTENLGNSNVAMDTRPTEEGEEADDVENPAHRMTTRAQAQASSNDKVSSPLTRSPSHDSSTPPYIHPLFLVPPSAIPDRDIGLPTVEADDTRRVLAMFVQKQEEVVRGAERLYEGLLKADRMRRTVFAWCKAEGHLGEMSDGEDWYDQEGWGLEEPLKKGQMDEEDDSAEKGKKTRGRRGAQ